MNDFVIDASALLELLVGAGPDQQLRARALTGDNSSPELLDIEAVQALRRLVHRRELDLEDGLVAVRHVRDAPITRISHRGLTSRIWELRDALTAYDAAYVVLAEQLDVPLLTCDARLGRAHGHRAEVVVYPRS